MKTLLTLLLISYCFTGFAQNTVEELAKIKETRDAFMLAIKEHRYQDLAKLSTADMENVGPGAEAWLKMYLLGQERGAFPYDRILMSPKETVIVSDSVAYDYGTSKVYYTDEEGEEELLTNTYLVILKKDKEGIWRLHREVASAQVK